MKDKSCKGIGPRINALNHTFAESQKDATTQIELLNMPCGSGMPISEGIDGSKSLIHVQYRTPGGAFLSISIFSFPSDGGRRGWVCSDHYQGMCCRVQARSEANPVLQLLTHLVAMSKLKDM